MARTTAGPQQSLKFEYDPKGRRIGKKVWNNLTFNGTPALEQKFVYDGWNLIDILDSNFSIQNVYVWGLDLSGSLQGAGGIGGLIETYDNVNSTSFAAFDGNGNVGMLVKALDGTVSARYEYGPFGEVIRATGPGAKANPFRFSTKYQDDETDLLYYGYRYYNTSIGRWLSMDPLGDRASFKIQLAHASESKKEMLQRQALLPPYLSFLNDSISKLDILGMWVARPTPPPANITTIVCQGGKAVPRLAPATSLNSQCVNRCIISHERQHADEANAQKACAGQPDGVAVAASSNAERVSSEIRAYQRELKCLKLAQKGATPPDDHGGYPKGCACRSGNVDSNINSATERLAGWEKADPNDPTTWPPDDL